MKRNGLIYKLLAGAFMACLFGFAAFSSKAWAEEAKTSVEVGATDYETLKMEIIRNGNTIVYSSIDNKKTWREVEGTVSGDKLIMDIKFAGTASNVSVWLKGDKDTSVLKVVIPKQPTSFKVKYDKSTGDFTFSGYGQSTEFEWHKSSDYNYKTVKFDKTDASYQQFLKDIAALTIKGSKIEMRLPGKPGKSLTDMGQRPGNVVKISIPKKSAAPNIKLNITMLTFNTRETMEYQVIGSGEGWKKCKKNMRLEEVTTAVLYENGANTVKIKFRNAKTEKKSTSMESVLIIKGQRKAPTIGAGGDVTIEAGTDRNEGKTVVTFKTASKENPFQYKIVKAGETNDPAKGWKTKKEGKPVVLSEKKLPKGSKILIRYMGVNANVNKGIEFKLPSACATYTAG
ncbi:MAG: hypothetical protein K5655_07565 [Lachnospiraceae bacterium]|jgi:hypothetical protein|nr:hypothetical protein [Lachnospiraceae bacterium]